MKLTGKYILITGGAGFIGSNLAQRILSENPASLVIVDNFFLGSEQNLTAVRQTYPDVQVLRMDASDLAAMQRVVNAHKIDVVYNLAVIPLPTSLEYPAWTVQTNVQIALTFCELARWGAFETLIHCSSSEAYGSALYSTMDESHPLAPTTPYAASKAAGDQIVLSYHQTFGIDTAIVRPFNNFGPQQNPGSYAGIIPIVVSRVFHGMPVEIYGDGLQTRDYIYVRDTTEAMVRIYESPATRGRVVNVATGQEITINDLVSRLLHVMDAANHPVIHTPERPGDVRRHRGDVSLLRELTSFTPNAIRDEDLAATVDWYLQYYRRG
ncbi:MAG TPA: SDR family NAD(P)-dependent oxidoreductase [Anaerolineaceae bacterium]|mgnify:CR=1 FL=1|nr:SDR family NAD(P)-dependent oxidoreductase [Anaerolineaceae bacterium]HQH85076.1 SDR family NAD(P)-dependent oxidoreductase [Anaerolineaceae bacterium]